MGKAEAKVVVFLIKNNNNKKRKRRWKLHAGDFTDWLKRFELFIYRRVSSAEDF